MLDNRLFYNPHRGIVGQSHRVGVVQGDSINKVFWLVNGNNLIKKDDSIRVSLDADCENCSHIFPKGSSIHRKMCLAILDNAGYTFINEVGPNICPNYRKARKEKPHK